MGMGIYQTVITMATSLQAALIVVFTRVVFAVHGGEVPAQHR